MPRHLTSAATLRRTLNMSNLAHSMAFPSRPAPSLALAALLRALASGGSGYDAYYLVLAEAADATLVTADRRLAEAASRAELIA